MLAGVKQINHQITLLAKVLNGKSISNLAEAKSSNPNVPIDMLSKKHEDAYYLFTVAMRNQPTDATFKINSGKSLEVIGENRSIKISNGQFEDHFNGYEVHLYKITADDTTR